MIGTTRKSILDSDCQTIVNTVNCVGIMGKGLARQFKQRYPEMYKNYKWACDNGLIRPGRVDLHIHRPTNKIIMNFPTKQHWRNPSQLTWIEEGLKDLRVLMQTGMWGTSIAIPPLGCGNGGLDWTDVEPLIRKALGDLGIRVVIYPPTGDPYELEENDRGDN